jgi:LacI family transcriptional regulator
LAAAHAPGAGTSITVRDVAREAGVHPGTVSRALNPKTEPLVNPATVRRVREVALRLGYRPNPIARGLKTGRSYTVGVLVPDIQNPLFPPIIRGIERGLGKAGYTPLIANTENDPERERVDFEALLARQVDGFITATASRGHELLDEMTRRGVPLVLVNRGVEDRSLPSATVDDRRGVRLAVEHLVGLGHRRIAYISGPQGFLTGYLRLQGFAETLDRLGLPFEPALIRVGNAFVEAEGARLFRQLVDQERRFTAVIAGNDLMALGCYDVLAESGLSCPGDVSVVGFNDMPFADRFHPPLTTVRVPHHRIGEAAAELLLERMASPTAPPRQVVLEPELVVRGSTGPPGCGIPVEQPTIGGPKQGGL